LTLCTPEPLRCWRIRCRHRGDRAAHMRTLYVSLSAVKISKSSSSSASAEAIPTGWPRTPARQSEISDSPGLRRGRYHGVDSLGVDADLPGQIEHQRCRRSVQFTGHEPAHRRGCSAEQRTSDLYDALVRCRWFHVDADGVGLGLLSFRLILHLTLRVRILVAVESRWRQWD
jgi:hypothetical protein